jgi:sulfatase maturation enzyme AslB (radical SAM superfamily)
MTSPTLADLSPATLAKAPPHFHLLAKPSGSTCNLDCTYCFFLFKACHFISIYNTYFGP